MRILLASAFGLMLSFSPVWADDETGHYLVYQFACSTYNEALRTGNPDPSIYEWYIRGWLVRYNQKTTRTYSLYKSINDAIQAFTDICKKSPEKKSNDVLDDMAEAAFEHRFKTADEYNAAKAAPASRGDRSTPDNNPPFSVDRPLGIR